VNILEKYLNFEVIENVFLSSGENQGKKAVKKYD
jgi:hypothetical protein